ncbi:MAG: hypothetical protein HPY50_05110 [Firmicutes bacterium]|nr:hypothetical protein [Bacillota bacterium]
MDEILVLSAAVLYIFWKRRTKGSSTQSTSPLTLTRPYLDFTISPRGDNTGMLFSLYMPMSVKHNTQQKS